MDSVNALKALQLNFSRNSASIEGPRIQFKMWNLTGRTRRKTKPTALDIQILFLFTNNSNIQLISPTTSLARTFSGVRIFSALFNCASRHKYNTDVFSIKHNSMNPRENMILCYILHLPSSCTNKFRQNDSSIISSRPYLEITEMLLLWYSGFRDKPLKMCLWCLLLNVISYPNVMY